MSLIPKSEIAFSKDGTKIYVTDKTGAYDATLNPGGWGAPNLNIYERCLMCLVIRKGSEGDELYEAIAPSVPYVYDDSAVNTEEKVFEVKYRIDTTMDVVLAVLPVSLDQTTYVDGGNVTDGDYYYYNGSIYHQESGSPVLVTDYLPIAEDANVLKDVCETFGVPWLTIKLQSIYKDYRIEREKKCDDADDLWDEYQHLLADIQGLSYTYYSGLLIEAQNQIEDLLDKHEITGL
jgi:hypothetical protein